MKYFFTLLTFVSQLELIYISKKKYDVRFNSELFNVSTILVSISCKATATL